ncbi:hypothetical protein [Dyella silvae]|nr:hypothetical protein [Dyella silvae]
MTSNAISYVKTAPLSVAGMAGLAWTELMVAVAMVNLITKKLARRTLQKK